MYIVCMHTCAHTQMCASLRACVYRRKIVPIAPLTSGGREKKEKNPKKGNKDVNALLAEANKGTRATDLYICVHVRICRCMYAYVGAGVSMHM